jgi:hypothetical protein
MGQRHQIYVALPPCGLCHGVGVRSDGIGQGHDRTPEGKPKCNGCSGTGYRFGRVIGIHHQWLFGRTALRLLRNFLLALDRAESPRDLLGTMGDPQKLLAMAYSFDPERGYFSNVHTLEAECSDPMLGDNNDGITVIDLRALTDPTESTTPPAGKIKVGMMFLDGAIGPGSKGHGNRPMSPLAYVEHYYSGIQKAVAGKGDALNARGETLPADDVAAVRADALDVARIAPKILTLAEIRKIFPGAKFPRPASALEPVPALYLAHPERV